MLMTMNESTLFARRRSLGSADETTVISAQRRPRWGVTVPHVMSLTHNAWRAIAWTTRDAPTRLTRVAAEDCVRVVAHGYGLAAGALLSAGVPESRIGRVWTDWLQDSVVKTLPRRTDDARPWGLAEWRHDRRRGRG